MKRLFPFVIALAILKVFIAFQMELGIDEAYYYTYAKKLEWSYFDHPLMVAVMEYISTLGLKFPQEFFLRFFPIVFGIINPFIVYKIAFELGSAKSAFIAAILYLATFYGSFVGGFLLIPDAPLSFFGLMSIYFGALFLKQNQTKYLYLFAVFLAFALSSKYQAIFIGIGLALTIIKFQKYLLKTPYLYVAIGITLLGFLPTLLWNANHDWDSFKFHSNRIGNAFLMEHLPREIFGQVIYQNPIVVGIVIFSLLKYKTVKSLFNSLNVYYLLAVSLPLIFLTFIISMFADTLPHWSGIAYVGLIILSAKILAEIKWNIKWLYGAYALFTISLIIGVTEVQVGMLGNQISKNQPVNRKGKGDFTQDLYGWKQFSDKFNEFRNHQIYDTDLLIAQRWFPAGNLDYYLARPLNMELIAEGPIQETHQYSFKDNLKYWEKNDYKGYFIAQSTSSFRPENFYDERYAITPLDTIFITRRNQIVRAHFIYLMEFKP